jgi:FAD:protein FMN transferase
MRPLLLALSLLTTNLAAQRGVVPRGGDAMEKTLERRVLSMGTELNLRLKGKGDLLGASVLALAECARIESVCSTWNPESRWSALNDAKGEFVALDPEWIALLSTCKAWSEKTQDAFDPVLGSLIRAWGIRAWGSRGIARIPSAEELSEAREAAGIAHLELSASGARLKHPRAAIEEGGFLKGYALERMAKALRAKGVHAACLDFGGQLRVWGEATPVSVANPKRRTGSRFSLLLSNASLSTSGCSERGRHILDPRSGELCPDWGSASVVMKDALEADILSTALYVMGPKAGLAWANEHHVSALFLFNDGRSSMSESMKALRPISLKESP